MAYISGAIERGVGDSSNPSSSSSSDDSDDDSDSDRDTLASVMSSKRKERKRATEKEKELAFLYGLGESQRDKKEKKIRIPEPDSFDGSYNGNPSYQRWFEKLNDYLRHHRGTWDGDEDLIRIFEAFMKGCARDWFDNRARAMRTAHQVDNFRAFVSAMDERFKDSREREEAFLKMQKTQYNGNVLKYVDTLQGLNQKVHLFGFPWRELIVNGLNPEFRKDLAKIQGGKPEEDDALVAAVKEVGLAHERYLQDEKRRTGNSKEKDGGTTKSPTYLWEPLEVPRSTWESPKTASNPRRLQET